MSTVKPFRVACKESKPAIEKHLLRLNVNDRYLRFCSALSDYAISGYVERLDLLGKDVVFAVSDADPTNIVGILHVAHDGKDSAEFALSVDVDARKRGIGDALFERGLLHCESVGIKHIYMNCLSTNEAIKKMAHKRGMAVTTDRAETIATLDISDTNAVLAWLKSVQRDSIALYDLNCKYSRHHWENYIAEIRKMVHL